MSHYYFLLFVTAIDSWWVIGRGEVAHETGRSEHRYQYAFDSCTNLGSYNSYHIHRVTAAGEQYAFKPGQGCLFINSNCTFNR